MAAHNDPSPRLVFTGPDGSCFIRLFSQHPTQAKIHSWVTRKMHVSPQETFAASYACDLDGSGPREVMLDDEEDLETLAHLIDNGFFVDQNVHVAVRIASVPLATSTASAFDAREDVGQQPPSEPMPSEEFQRLLSQLIAGSSPAGPALVEEQVKNEETRDEDHVVVRDETTEDPAPVVTPAEPESVPVVIPAASSAKEVPTILAPIQTSLSPIAPAFEPSAAAAPAIPSIAIETASSLASSVCESSHADLLPSFSRPASPVAPSAPGPAAKKSGLAILARRLPSPVVASFPDATQPAAPSSSIVANANVKAAKEGGKHSFRPSADDNAAHTAPQAVRARSTTQEADEFLASRSFEELRWADYVDSPPRTRTVPGSTGGAALSPDEQRQRQLSAAGERPPVGVVGSGAAVAAREQYRQLSVGQESKHPSLPQVPARQAQAPVDHVPGAGARAAAPDAEGAVDVDRVALDAEDVRQSHYQRQQCPPQARGASSSSSTGTQRFASSSTRTSHPSPTSSNAPSTPGDLAPSSVPAKFALSAASAPFTPPPAKPIFTGFAHTPSPELVRVNLAFTHGTADVPAFGEEIGELKPNKRVKVRSATLPSSPRPKALAPAPAAAAAAAGGADAAPSSTDASPLLVSSAFPASSAKRSVTPTGVEYTSLRHLFPSLFPGPTPPRPQRPTEVRSWLPEARTGEYKKAGKCFRCGVVGHLKVDCPY